MKIQELAKQVKGVSSARFDFDENKLIYYVKEEFWTEQFRIHVQLRDIINFPYLCIEKVELVMI